MEDTSRECLVLFSGGFDSMAVAHKVIVKGGFKEVDLLFNDNTVFVDDLEIAKRNAKVLVAIGKKHKVKVNFKIIKSSTPYGQNDVVSSMDLCLLVHLSVIMLTSGEYKNVYLGWNKNNIERLEYAKVMWSAIESMVKDFVNIFWLEEIYYHKPEFINNYNSKEAVVEYLLNNNLFSICTTGNGIVEGKHWYSDTDAKWREVLSALVDLEFSVEELSKVLESNSLETVQEIWNSRVKVEQN